MTNSWTGFHKTWVAMFSRRICTVRMVSTLVTPYTNHHKDFSLPAPIASFYSFVWIQMYPHIILQIQYHSLTVLLHPHTYTHLKCYLLPPHPTHWPFTTCGGIEKKLSTLGLKQENRKLNVLPNCFDWHQRQKDKILVSLHILISLRKTKNQEWVWHC